MSALEGAVLTVADDVNTDVVYPGRYLTIVDWSEQALHAFEGLGEHWPVRVRAHPVLCAGWNFGCGSSREQAVTALIGAGVKLVVAKSFARLYLRNCINNGLAVVESPELADAASAAGHVQVDLAAGLGRAGGEAISFPALPPPLLSIVMEGGLLRRLARSHGRDLR
jgi:3-isopropylmalate/(R)-2-methylmalate dehydratase small subunit